MTIIEEYPYEENKLWQARAGEPSNYEPVDSQNMQVDKNPYMRSKSEVVVNGEFDSSHPSSESTSG